jgi:hypothetical protein
MLFSLNADKNLFVEVRFIGISFLDDIIRGSFIIILANVCNGIFSLQLKILREKYTVPSN